LILTGDYLVKAVDDCHQVFDTCIVPVLCMQYARSIQQDTNYQDGYSSHALNI
jgi:hypothetical protein